MRSQIKRQISQWVPSSILAFLVVAVLYFFISLPPALGQAANVDSELLAKQLEFVLKMNTAFLGFLGIAGSIAAYFFGKSFKEFQEFSKENVRDIYKASEEKIQRIHESSEAEIKKAIESIREKAQREVSYLIDGEVRETVRAEVRSVQRILERERVISSTSVDYYLPGGMSHPIEEPQEVELLRAREFKNVQYFTEISELRPKSSDVVVLDLIHFSTVAGEAFKELSKEERDSAAKPILEELMNLFPKSSVLIVYVNSRPFLGGIDSDERYILAANSPITVVGNTADGAYVAKGARKVAQDV